MKRYGLILTLFGFLVAAPATAHQPTARLLVSNPAPFTGEEVIVTLEIRTDPRPPGPVQPYWPSPDNMAVTDLSPLPPRLEEGRPMTLVQSAQRALRPLRTGVLSITGAGAVMDGRVYAAPTAELRVSPLPESGRPADFAGAVGRITMELDAEGRGNREIRLIISGDAPLETFPVPTPRPGSGERLISIDDATVGSAPGVRTRTLRYLYLPGGQNRGRISFHLPVFDPLDRRYVNHSAGIRYLPAWPRHAGLSLLLLVIIAGVTLYVRHLRRPRRIEAALVRLFGPEAIICSHDLLLQRLAVLGADQELLRDLAAFWQSRDLIRFAPEAVRRESAAPGLWQEERLVWRLVRLKPMSR